MNGSNNTETPTTNDAEAKGRARKKYRTLLIPLERYLA